MPTRGWGIARKMAVGGMVPPKPLFMPQAINKPKTHHTATSALNLSNTQRKPRFRLG